MLWARPSALRVILNKADLVTNYFRELISRGKNGRFKTSRNSSDRISDKTERLTGRQAKGRLLSQRYAPFNRRKQLNSAKAEPPEAEDQYRLR